MVLQWFASLSAGILEEFAYVVAPIAGWCAAIASIDIRRDRQHQHPVSPRVYRAGIVVLVAVGMLLRFNLHTYQGLLPALLWAGVNIAVFLWSRSLLALVVAHTLFDALFASSIGLGLNYWGTPWVALGAAVAAAATAWALTMRGRKQRLDRRSSDAPDFTA